MNSASPKQINFLRDLVNDRVLDVVNEKTIRQMLDMPTFTSREASNWISHALAQPRKPKAAPAPATTGYAAANAALADVPVSFYAIPAGYVSAQSIDLYGNDYLFVRVRHYNGRPRVSRVSGSYAAPRYSGVSPAVALVVAQIVRERHVEFARLWHEVSGRCGKCNALLTDAVSRAKGFGPDCAKMLGI